MRPSFRLYVVKLILPALVVGRAQLPMDYSPECVGGVFSEAELQLYAVLRSSAIIQHRGMGKDPSLALPFCGLRLGVCVFLYTSRRIASLKEWPSSRVVEEMVFGG